MHLVKCASWRCTISSGTIGHGCGNVVEQALPLPSIEQAEQRGNLAIVVIADAMVVPVAIARDPQRWLLHRRILPRAVERIRLVVGVGVATVVTGEPHRAVLVIIVHRHQRRVHRQSLVVRADPMTMRVGVGEDACLQHLVRAEPDAGHYIGWAQRQLLDFGEVVVGIPVQLDDANLDQREVSVRPDLGEVERVERLLLGVQFRHDLHTEPPLRELTPLDRTEKILLVSTRGSAR